MAKFKSLWENYPSSAPCLDKNGKVPAGYDNQCAIKVGYALEKCGVSFASYKGGRCPGAKKTSGMVTSAQDLANWLGPSRFTGCSKAETFTGKEVFEKIDGRTGIIFLANYYKRSSDTATRTGDHIDLWNGSRLTSSSSWIRVHFGIAWDGVWSDYRGASKVIFWEIE